MNDEISSEEIVSQLKELRVALDRVQRNIRSTQQVMTANRGTREVASAYTKLQECRMWLGAALGEVGHELPEEYADKYRPNAVR